MSLNNSVNFKLIYAANTWHSWHVDVLISTRKCFVLCPACVLDRKSTTRMRCNLHEFDAGEHTLNERIRIVSCCEWCRLINHKRKCSEIERKSKRAEGTRSALRFFYTPCFIELRIVKWDFVFMVLTDAIIFHCNSTHCHAKNIK